MDRAPNLLDFPSETKETPKHESAGSDYKDIAREVLARIDQRLADLDDTPPDRSESRFKEFPETVRGLMSTDDEAVYVRRAWRGLIGLVLAASLVAAISFLWSHDETAEQTVAQVPRSAQDSTGPAEKPQPSPEPGPPAAAKAKAEAAKATIVEAAPAQAAPLPRTAPHDDKPNPAPVAPELAELMRKVDRNIAGLAQAVTELRLAQQQVAGDNAKAVEDIKASLDQMASAMAAPPEQQVRPPEQAKATEQVRAPEQAKAPGQAKAPVQATQPKPTTPASRTAARRDRRSAPMYMLPTDALASELFR
jgi:hypothetical protein